MAQSGAEQSSDGSESFALQLRGVRRRFGGLTAVNDVSLDLPIGGRLAVIGPNGAGKTTLFRMIAGEMRVSAGTISFFGRDITNVSERSRARGGISRTFQISNLFPSLSVTENVVLAAQAGTVTARRFWWLSRESDLYALRAEAALDRVGLHPRRKDRVSDLSHGEQRQLEIAMALVAEPRLLLLDEPAAGLSGSERVVLRRLLQELPESLSFLLIEHDMSLALEIVDTVLCLDNGTPLAQGTPNEIRNNETVRSVYLGRRH